MNDQATSLTAQTTDSTLKPSVDCHSIIFSSGTSSEIFRIKPDGRLEKGPGLSDDEASVRFFEVCRKVFDGRVKELENRLAAERAKVEQLRWAILSVMPDPPYDPIGEPQWVYCAEALAATERGRGNSAP